MKHLPSESDRNHVIAALRELIHALDRRVRQVERVGEIRIAREAAALREDAVRRISELESAEADLQMREAEAVMSDDGGPGRKA
jgi:hypothetical protein